jgi:uncharacterized protein (DUF924 family)
MTASNYEAVLTFWFSELSEEQWFHGGPAVDSLLKERFTTVHTAVAANEHWQWRETVRGALAEVLVLDQFSRNLFRGTPRAFAADAQALALAQVAVARGFDQVVSERERPFFYMPYMHSESAVIHEEAVRLFESLGSEEHLKFEHIHKDIIDRFGRYPHRNEVLNRVPTPEEEEYLNTNDEVFFNA